MSKSLNLLRIIAPSIWNDLSPCLLVLAFLTVYLLERAILVRWPWASFLLEKSSESEVGNSS